MPDSILLPLCTPDTHIRSNYYSDTYRASFAIRGVNKQWDITHIELPFPKEKERLLMARFGIAQEDVNKFYAMLGRCIKNDISIVKHIASLEETPETVDEAGKKKPDPVAQVKSSVVNYEFVEAKRKDGQRGSDVYFATEPMEPFVGSEFFSGQGITLRNYLSFGARFAQILKSLSVYGVHVGALDMDTVFLRKEEGKTLILLGCFLYGGQDTDQTPVAKPVTMPLFADESVRSGAAPTLVSDMHALTAMLWSIADGQHYNTPPNYENAPRYAPDELTELLVMGRDSNDEDTLRIMVKGFYALMKKIKREEIEDTVIHLAPPPSYTIQEPEPQDAPQEREAQNTAALPEEQPEGPEHLGTQKPEHPQDEEPECQSVQDDFVFEDVGEIILPVEEEKPAKDTAPPDAHNAAPSAEEQPEADKPAQIQVAQVEPDTGLVVECPVPVPQAPGSTETAPPKADDAAEAAPEHTEAQLETAVTPPVQQTEPACEIKEQPSQVAAEPKAQPAVAAAATPPPAKPPASVSEHPDADATTAEDSIPEAAAEQTANPALETPPQEAAQPEQAAPPSPPKEQAVAPQEKPAPPQKVVRRTVTTTYQRKPKKRRLGAILFTLLSIAVITVCVLGLVQYLGYNVPYNIPFVDELRASTQSFTVTPSQVDILVGEEVYLESSAACTLNSSDHSVATVSDTGYVKGIGPGTCTIIARATGSTITATVDVTVHATQ